MNENQPLDDVLYMIEDVRVGLQSLDEEEENLIILKNHLAKIKKIRDEQIRKDGLIVMLKERISVLENERVNSNRQTFELEEILSERIFTLENSLKDNNELQLKFDQVSDHVEVLNTKCDRLSTDLEAEQNRVHSLRLSIAEKDDEILSLKSSVYSEQQVIQQLQVVFSTLKAELHSKETAITNCTRQYRDDVGGLQQELSVSQQSLSDMADRIVQAEELLSQTQDQLSAASNHTGALQSDLVSCSSELKQWKEMYQELETVLLALKAQLSATQEGFSQEAAGLRADLARSKQSNRDTEAELISVQQVLSSIAQDMNIITSQQQNKQTSSRALSTQRAEVLALALSLKRSTATLDNHKTNSAVGNTRARINKDIQFIVKFVCDAVHRSVAQQEGESELSDQLHDRTAAVSSASALFSKLELKYATLKQELSASDAAVTDAVSTLQSALSFAGHNPAHSPGKGLRDLRSESRMALFEQLQRGVDAAVRSAETVSRLESRLAEDALSHEDDVRDMHSRHAADLRTQSEKYESAHKELLWEVERLKEQLSQAEIAVRFTSYENEIEVQRLRDQYQQRLTSNTTELTTEQSDLRGALSAVEERYRQVALSLEHLLRYVFPLHYRFKQLRATYALLHNQLYLPSTAVHDEIRALADCCGRLNLSLSHGTDGEEVYGTDEVHPQSQRRPRASSREQRLRKRDQQQQKDLHSNRVVLHSLRQVRRVHSLRVVVLMVIAAKRLQQLGQKDRRAHDNLFSASALRDSLRHSLDHRDFALFYPAFELPLQSELLSQTSEHIAKRLLEGAAVLDQRDSSGTTNHIVRGTSLLDVVKLKRFNLSPRKDRESGEPGGRKEADLQVVHRSLVDMGERLQLARKEENKFMAIIESLEDKISALQGDLAKSAAKVHLQACRIDQLERERRFGSLTILRDIHNELRQDNEAATSVSESQQTVPVVNASAPVMHTRSHFVNDMYATVPVSSRTDHQRSHRRDGAHNGEAVNSVVEGELLDDSLRSSEDLFGPAAASSQYAQSSEYYSSGLQHHSQSNSSRQAYTSDFEPSSSSSAVLRTTHTASRLNSRYSSSDSQNTGTYQTDKHGGYHSNDTSRDNLHPNGRYQQQHQEDKAVKEVKRQSSTPEKWRSRAAQYTSLLSDSSVASDPGTYHNREDSVVDQSYASDVYRSTGLDEESQVNSSSDINNSSSVDSSAVLDDSHYRRASHLRTPPQSPSSRAVASVYSNFVKISSAEKNAHSRRDDDILEIYSDIGRLTGKLESRLKASANVQESLN